MNVSHIARLGCLSLFLSNLGCSSGEPDSSVDPSPAFDASYLDPAVAPCDDFYRFACGTWLTQHPPRPGYGEQRFSVGDQRFSLYFQQLVDAMSSNDPKLASARSFNARCMSASSTSRASAPALSGDLDAIARLESLDELPALLARLHDAGVAALFWAGPVVDIAEPSRHVLGLYEGGWSLHERGDYEDPSLIEAYSQHMAALSAEANASASLRVTVDGEAALAVERRAAAMGTDVRDPRRQHSPLDAAALSAAAPSFAWAEYFEARGYGSVEQLDAGPAELLPALEALLSTVSVPELRAYLTWRVLESSSALLDRPLLREERRFHAGQELEAASSAADEYRCLIATRNVFGFELSRYFVDRFVPAETKARGTALVATIREQMTERLAGATWLDDATRTRALSKLEAITAHVGYPDRWPAPVATNLAGSTYFDAWRFLAEESSRKARLRLGQPVDTDEFDLSPETTNATYDPQRNVITIPVAVLQRPFFDPDQAASFGYGALGTLIGHELSHAFDDTGRLFDERGKLDDWWSEATTSEFEQRAQCLVSQYSSYESSPGISIDGSRTLGENIADLGGMQLAWAAFQADPRHDASVGTFSADQQFFLSYAQLWCASFSDFVTERLAASDPHSPNEWRVNGVLRNLPEFANAFSCQSGAPLAPRERCAVW